MTHLDTWYLLIGISVFYNILRFAVGFFTVADNEQDNFIYERFDSLFSSIYYGGSALLLHYLSQT